MPRALLLGLVLLLQLGMPVAAQQRPTLLHGALRGWQLCQTAQSSHALLQGSVTPEQCTLNAVLHLERAQADEQLELGDYPYHGAVIGAVLFGALAFAASEGLCDRFTGCTGRSIAAALAWGAAGGITGALIGTAIPRSKGSADASSSAADAREPLAGSWFPRN